MRRFDRYLLAEMVVPALMGGVMVVMLLVGNQLYFMLRYLYRGVPVRDVAMTLAYFSPSVLMLSIPAALLLGAALGLNRLERDREILSLRMAGVRLKRIVAPIIVLGLLASGLMFYLQERVIPQNMHRALELQRKLGVYSPTAVVQEDQVLKFDRGGTRFFIYVNRVDPSPDRQILHDVTILMVGDQRPPVWLMIPRAENRSGRWWMLSDPVTGEQPRGYTPGSSIITYDDALMNIPAESMNAAFERRDTAELTFHELYAALQNGERGVTVYNLNNGIMLDRNRLLFYLHRKLAAPLAALVAILIAIPLAIHFGRSGGYVGLLLSVIVAFCFIVSQQWAQVLAEMGRAQPVIAAWAPNAVFGLLGLVLLFREE